MSDTLCSTKVTGPRRPNVSIGDDGLLDLKLAPPRTLGGKGDATNQSNSLPAAMPRGLRMPSRASATRLAANSAVANSKLSARLASAAMTPVRSCYPPRSP
jgi:hypothetical protein